MKTITILTILIIWGCQSPRLITMRRTPSIKLDTVRIDSTYELFVRSVYKNPVTNEPTDSVLASENIVESEYMFISLSYRKAIVINNIPNRNQIFYNADDSHKLLETNGELNARYFKQLRFGTIKTAENGVLIYFTTTDKKPQRHVWVCEKITDADTSNHQIAAGYTVSSVQTLRPDGYDQRATEGALFLVPKYLKREDFKIVYKRSAEGKAQPPTAELPGNTLMISRHSKRSITTYLIFNTDINNKGHRVLAFPPKRMYAWPSAPLAE